MNKVIIRDARDGSELEIISVDKAIDKLIASFEDTAENRKAFETGLKNGKKYRTIDFIYIPVYN